MSKVANRRVSKPLLGSNVVFRVKCDLRFEDSEVAFAFKRIVERFETSALRRDGKRANSA